MMRCESCSYENPPGLARCQACNAHLPPITCPHCNFRNPPDHTFCGQCGQAVDTGREPGRERRRVQQASSTYILSIVGFGAILVVASVAYPWYFLGDHTAVQASDVTMFNQLDTGWSWFPGLPLLLIILSASLSTFLVMLAIHRKVSPVAAVFPGLVNMLCLIWLWQGLIAGRPGPGDHELTPMLATVGAIVVLVGGALMAGPLLSRQRNSASAISGGTLRGDTSERAGLRRSSEPRQ